MKIRFLHVFAAISGIALTIAMATSLPPIYEPTATQYNIVMPMVWECTGWTSWVTIGYGCSTQSVCENGCPVRVKLQRRTRTCTAEDGTVFLDSESRNLATGCCSGPGSQCLDPLVGPTDFSARPIESMEDIR